MNKPVVRARSARGSRRRLADLCLLLSLLCLPVNALAAEDFAAWLAAFRQEAAAQGISAPTLALLDNVQPLRGSIASDRNQPEKTITADKYIRAVLSDKRVAAAQTHRRDFAPLLETVGKEYGVQPHFLVALWGIESYFGTRAGDFPVVRALATLAWEGRRPFYRKELLAALKIIDEGHIDAERLKGSWAGASGQFQFMPTSFQNFAVDQDQDGRRDIWTNTGDALASAANYLKKCGWRAGEGWGQEVLLPPGFDSALAGLKTRKTLDQWRQLGVKGVTGENSRQASLLLPDGPEGAAFLVGENFRTLLSWNRSTHFALAVSLMADRIQAMEVNAAVEPGALGDKLPKGI